MNNTIGENELIRLFVNPANPSNTDFFEVTPTQLETFLSEQRGAPRAKRKRNPYHNTAIMAKVCPLTTEIELDRLYKHHVRTLFVQKNCNKPQDLKQMFQKIHASREKFYEESIYRTPIGVVVEVTAELLVIGRLRNDEHVYLDEKDIVILTNNEEYKNCCFKEILYVSNLWRYSNSFKIGDIIRIGKKNDIEVKVVKSNTMCPLTVKVMKAGLLKSFMRLTTPYYIEAKELDDKDIADIDGAIKYGADFILVPQIRSLSFLKAIKEHIGENINLIGSIDIEYLEKKFIDITDVVMELDGVMIDDIISPSCQKLLGNAITSCRNLKKPVIAYIPLQKCSDFKRLENHSRVKQMDCLMIQKSPLRLKFPIIVKKLLPVGNRHIDIPPLDSLSCKDGIVNFVLRTIYMIPCQAIIITNMCPKAAEAFSLFDVYCPVIVVVDNDQTARLLNLRNNIRTIVSDDKEFAMDIALDYGRKHCIISTGDFIIAISDAACQDENVCVNLRAYFLPPPIIIKEVTAEEIKINKK